MTTTSYYDPTTDMIHMFKDENLSNTAGASLDLELGLTDFSDLTDPKIKILSIEYKVKTFCDNFSTNSSGIQPDNNLYAFNNEEKQAGGHYMFGVKNKDDTTVYRNFEEFVGSSAWPVYCTSWIAQIGLPASCTKTWKPDKLALSDEQVAFLTVRNNSGVVSSSNSYSRASIVIRAIRL